MFGDCAALRGPPIGAWASAADRIPKKAKVIRKYFTAKFSDQYQTKIYIFSFVPINLAILGCWT
jgi:hypothetical protein